MNKTTKYIKQLMATNSYEKTCIMEFDDDYGGLVLGL